MINFALNHMTVARASYRSLLDVAAQAGCSGIEIRNDLASALFDGQSPQQASAAASERGLQIHSVAEVQAFNRTGSDSRRAAAELIGIAAACGSQAISLIPANDGTVASEAERRGSLLAAMRVLQPMLESNGLTGLIEPLGFASASLRFKAEVVEAIVELDAADTFKIVHDTFHHHLSGEQAMFPAHTGMVHLSGVVDKAIDVDQMLDCHRGLVDADDRLANIDQLRQLSRGGYTGPISLEAFAPAVHDIADPAQQLAESYSYIASQLRACVA